jgi:predicted ATPase
VATLKALERDQRQRPHLSTLVLLADALGLDRADRDALLGSVLTAERVERPSAAGGSPRLRLVEPADEPPAVPAVRLPSWLTSFVGREAEVETVRMLLDPSTSDVRLLTLIGPGGVGKTRLAAKAAADLSHAYPQGVVFVDLASLSDPHLVPATIARALGLGESSGQGARDLLLDYLRPCRALLVLDTFEHLREAVPQLADLLQACSQLALLITSRNALHLRAERRVQVAPLATPPVDSASVEVVSASPAVRLFVDRAQAVAPDFMVDSANAVTVARVCRRLDGMPLAIELAAARAGLLEPAALLQRLERRLALLTRGAADLPERQQTLRHTLAWSHALLESGKQALFRRLAVFSGGWTLDAVESVCMRDATPSEDVVDALGVLVDNSLIYKTLGPDEEPRFAMLDIVREYAEEQLIDSGEADATRRRHAAFYLETAERAAPELRGANQAVWLQRMEHEHANVGAALDWLIERHELADEALRLATAATWFWLRRGYLTDAQRLIRLLNATKGQGSAVRAAALIAAARLASTMGNWIAQARFNAESMRLFRELGDSEGTALAVTDLGVAYWEQGRLDEAEVHLDEGLRLFRTLGDSVGIATAVLPLACVCRDRGDLDVARPLFAEALTLRNAAHDQLGAAHVLNHLGWLELYAGRVDVAHRVAEESLTIRLAFGLPQAAGMSETLLGQIALAKGERSVAGACFSRSLAAQHGFGNVWAIAIALEGVAALLAQAQPGQAVRLAAAADALRRSIGRPLPPIEHTLLARWLAPALRTLSPEDAERARVAGSALSEAQAIEEAHGLLAALASSQSG